MRVAGDFFHRLEIKRLWDGRPVPLGLKRRLVREYERFEMVNRQIEQVLAERAQELEMSCTLDVQKVRQLLRLRGVGITTAWLSVMEFFAWRNFRNRRQVGALAGLTPTPHQSGDGLWERDISKSGNRHIFDPSPLRLPGIGFAISPTVSSVDGIRSALGMVVVASGALELWP